MAISGKSQLHDSRARFAETSDRWGLASDAVGKATVDLGAVLVEFGEASGALAEAHRSYEDLRAPRRAGSAVLSACNRRHHLVGGR